MALGLRAQISDGSPERTKSCVYLKFRDKDCKSWGKDGEITLPPDSYPLFAVFLWTAAGTLSSGSWRMGNFDFRFSNGCIDFKASHRDELRFISSLSVYFSLHAAFGAKSTRPAKA